MSALGGISRGISRFHSDLASLSPPLPTVLFPEDRFVVGVLPILHPPPRAAPEDISQIDVSPRARATAAVTSFEGSEYSMHTYPSHLDHHETRA